MERRKFVKSVGLITAAAYVGPAVLANNTTAAMSSAFEGTPSSEFPPLPYSYDALEPYIDARTMEIHYDRHHRAYYSNYINAIKDTPLESVPVNDIFSSISKQTDTVRNNSGGYYNHLFFWNNLSSKTAGPSSVLSEAIVKSFSSFDKFREAFNTAAKSRFGSGWAWLYLNSDKILAIGSTPNQDNPLMDNATVKGTPLLTLDVWEHAYYLKYQNKRADYIDAFWNIVNWEEVSRRYEVAVNG
jgi:Fe-Mn family superoxide dismutase